MPTLWHDAPVGGRNQAQIDARALVVLLHHQGDVPRTNALPASVNPAK
jgi:hypothetical protein